MTVIHIPKFLSVFSTHYSMFRPAWSSSGDKKIMGGKLQQCVCINNCPTRCNNEHSIYFMQGHSTCFGCRPHPSSAVHKTVTAASGTGHIIGAATSFQRGQVRSPNLATLE